MKLPAERGANFVNFMRPAMKALFSLGLGEFRNEVGETYVTPQAIASVFPGLSRGSRGCLRVMRRAMPTNARSIIVENPNPC